MDQKKITKNKSNVPYEKVFVIYSEKLMPSFFDLPFLKFYASYKKTNDIFWNFEEVPRKKRVLLMQKIFI